MHRIAIHPAFDRHGRRLHGKFVASLDGRQLCVSRQPLLDAARILLAEGADPADTVAMRHAGSDHDAMTATVGAAERLTVREGARRGPTFRRWKAFSRDHVQAPVRFDAPPLSDTGASAERILAEAPA
jgi:hypothetical protein